MDTKLRNQLTGAVIWFVFLILIVGRWYSHPVHFDPDGVVAKDEQADKAVIVDKPLRVADAAVVPSTPTPATDAKAAPKAPEKPEKQVKLTAPAPENTQKAVSVAKPAKTKKPVAKKVGDPLSGHPATPRKKAAMASKRWLVKVAAYFTARQANELVATLNEQGYDATYKTFKNSKGQTVYSVRLAPVDSKAKAQRLKRIIDRRFHTRSIIEPLPPQA